MTNKIILTSNFKKSSLVKIGDISYMPRPSYETLPAIPLYSSNDLLNWELVTHVFNDNKTLNLTGIDSQSGIWSPSLSHDGKKFYLVYSFVKSFGGNNLNLDNFVITATDITKKWSTPTYLNSNKASSILIHRGSQSYLISLRLNIETEYEATRAIVIQEFDKKTSTLIGEETIIAKPVCRGELFSEILFEEENDIFKLTLVEYTQNRKKATVLTSPELFGMYHVLKFDDDVKILQKSVLNKERKAIANINVAVDVVNDIVDAIETNNGIELYKEVNSLEFDEALEMVEVVTPPAPAKIYTDSKEQGVYTLREELDKSWYVKTETKESYKISLRGRNSLSSKFEQSFIGKAVTEENYDFQTKLSFIPENIYQSAGIACYYDNDNYYYLRLYKSETFEGLTVGVTSTKFGEKFEILHHGIKLGENIKHINLRLIKHGNSLQFQYSLFKKTGWVNVSSPIDVTSVQARFDGINLIGITSQDQNNKSAWADFYQTNFLGN